MKEEIRCSWLNMNNETYVRYHDEEWGRPLYDDQKLYELLILECFQAGLSWECVLNKRENFRAAFDGFDIDKVVQYDEKKKQELINDPGIIRNRLKIKAAVNNSIVFKKFRRNMVPSAITYGLLRITKSCLRSLRKGRLHRCPMQSPRI